MTARLYYALLFVVVLLLRLCHRDIVWVEEGYPLAAAAEMLRGKALYSEIWFDKPPFFPAFYMLFGALAGWPLRVAGALYVLLSAWAVGRVAAHFWGQREERLAAALTAFALTFGIPASVMVIGPDLMLIPLQAAAFLAAWKRQAFAAGLLAGIGVLINGKMLLLLPVMIVLRPVWLAGFLAPQLLLLPVASAYWMQVWAWGSMYSRDTFIANPVLEGLQRTTNWMGFHAAIVIGAAVGLREQPAKRRWLLWIACALVALTAGLRFSPRYYFLLLPPLTILAARGLAGGKRPLVLRPLGNRTNLALPSRDRQGEVLAVRVLVLLLLLIPFIRFGPRYIELAQGKGSTWSDLAMEQDSRAAAALLKGEGTLLVWGYRPEIYVLSGKPAATRFLDSQPLTGVFADRHLTNSTPTAAALARTNRAELMTTKPEWIVDGLGPYNPQLAITQFEDLRPWLQAYVETGRTQGTIIYRRRSSP